MPYLARIVADSVGPHRHRLTTFEVTFPRMVLADMTRHRVLSYSFESTRAVPTETRIQQVKDEPYIPTFRRRAKGMGGGEALSEGEQIQARATWLQSRDAAVRAAEALLWTGKEHVGRILEPYAWITGIVSGTEWENFFALRCPPPGEHPDPKWPAQHELQEIAYRMETLYRYNEPKLLDYGDWHLPMMEGYTPLTPDDARYLAEASAGKCAAVSYLNHHREETPEAAAARWNERLAPSAHWSPGEHPAQCMLFDHVNFGNYRGWKQLRKFYPTEKVRPRSIQT